MGTLPVLESFDGHAHNGIGAAPGFVLLEGNVIGPFDAAAGVGGKQPGPVALRPPWPVPV